MFNKLKKKIIYALTKKPEHYVRVDRPKTLQEHRQVQYNKWCIAKGAFNGSYLPNNPNTLLKKGWTETTNFKNTAGDNRELTRKSSGQRVRYDSGVLKSGKVVEKHYHWYNACSNTETKKLKNATLYLDRYGNTCAKGAAASHLAPYDKEYKMDWRKK